MRVREGWVAGVVAVEWAMTDPLVSVWGIVTWPEGCGIVTSPEGLVRAVSVRMGEC